MLYIIRYFWHKCMIHDALLTKGYSEINIRLWLYIDHVGNNSFNEGKIESHKLKYLE